MKKSKRFLAAFAVLCLAAMLLSSSTFAWFSMNEKGAATGLEIHVKTSASIKIAQTTGLGTATMPENLLDYGSQVVVNTGVVSIQPVSSVDGQNFFMADSTDIGDFGEYRSTDFMECTPQSMSANYGTSDTMPYADYVLAIYSTNSSTTDRNIILSGLKLTYSQGTDSDEAFRVAVFVQKANSDAADETPTLLSIMGSEGSSYFTTENAYSVSSEEEGTEAGDLWAFSAGRKTVYGNSQVASEVTAWYSDEEGTKDITNLVSLGKSGLTEQPYAIASTSLPLEAVKFYNNPVTIGSVPAKGLAYYKVTIRLWLEGEDQSCTNDTFATLDDVWNLDVGFGMSSDNIQPINILERELITSHFVGLALGDESTAEYPFDNKTFYAYRAYLQGEEVTLYSFDSVLTEDSQFFQMKDRRMTKVTSYTDLYVGSIQLGTTNQTPVNQNLFREETVVVEGKATTNLVPATVYEYEVRGLGAVYAFDTEITNETVFYRSNVDNVLVKVDGNVRFD